MRPKNLDYIFFGVILYVIVAGSWWSYLLLIKNEDAKNAKIELMRVQYQQTSDSNAVLFEESAAYTKLIEKYDRQRWMILGEAVVLLFFMIIGIWRIYISRQKELLLAKQQQNFLLSITHELKSPLAAIKLVLQTLKRPNLKEEQSDHLINTGLKDSNRLHKLVNDLLLAARVDGGYQFEFERVNFTDIVLDAVDAMEAIYEGDIQTVDVQPDVYLDKADPNTLQSLVTNLLENAVKYSGDGKIIKVALNTTDKYGVLNIDDEGIGIPKEERNRVFNKFYRVGTEETRKTKGTGLGLYIVHHFVKAHGGSVQIQPNNPKGTRFTVRIPRS